MSPLEELFKNNREWSGNITRQQPDFFQRLATQQNPRYLWIGCSDSRVPANEIVGLDPGELFVHRNVANIVVHSDLNCLSVLQYAVDVLHVEHVIVCGHYGCGGVRAAYENSRYGLIDNWLRHVQDIHQNHLAEINACAGKEEAMNRLCELNVMNQVMNVGETTIVDDAWHRGRIVTLHGWIYGLHNGLIRDLSVTLSNRTELSILREQLKTITGR